MLLAMHVYIVAHFAHADVYGLNWMTAHCLYYCHIHTPTVEFGSIHPAALLFLIAEFVYVKCHMKSCIAYEHA